MQVSTCLKVFFSKVADPENSNFIKKRLQQRCFSVNFGRFLGTFLDRAPLGNCLFHVKCAEFHSYSKKLFHGCLSSILFKNQKKPFRGALITCSRRTPMPKCDFNKVAKSHLGMGDHLSIGCIFSEHLFPRTPLGGCF